MSNPVRRMIEHRLRELRHFIEDAVQRVEMDTAHLEGEKKHLRNLAEEQSVLQQRLKEEA